MKKLFSLLLLTIFCITTPLQGFALTSADTSKLTKNVIISKSNLEKNLTNGSKYVRSINKIIEAKKDDKAYLEMLVEKLSSKRDQFIGSDDKNSLKIIYIIDYIVAAANKQIGYLEEVSVVDVSVIDTTLSQDDIDMVEQRVLSLQSNLIDTSEDIFAILEKYTAYQQSGSYQMNLNIDEDSFGTLMGELKIKNYVAKNNLFDSQFTGDVEGRIEYSIASQDLKLEFSSFVDAISKDGQFYVLLDEVKTLIERDNPELASLADISEKISTDGKYVRFSDENLGDFEISKEMVENALNINKYRSLLENPILKVYQRDGEKYYLVPTEEFCSEAKKVFGGILGNLGDGGCSESQYSDMVKEFLSETDVYMTMNGDISTVYVEEKTGTSKMNISFDENNIISANMNIIDDSSYNPMEMSMSYNKGESMNISFESPGFTGTFDSVLNTNNTFKSFDMVVDGGEDFNMNINLSNESLTGNILVSARGQEMLTADISGTLKQDYLDMNVVFEFMDFITGGENIEGNMKMMLDTRNNKNNADFGLYIERAEKNILEFKILSESTIKYGEVDIQAPTDFVEAEDVWSKEDFQELY